MKTRFFTTMMMALFLVPLAGQAEDTTFDVSDFKGNYAYVLAGNFTQIPGKPGLPEADYVEVGVYKPDGMGNLDFSPALATSVGELNGEPIQREFFNYFKGTYTVSPEGILRMEITVYDETRTIGLFTTRCVGVLGGRNSKVVKGIYLLPVTPGDRYNVHGSAIRQKNRDDG